MKKLKFKTTLSSFQKGEKPCYRAQVITNGTVTMDTLVQDAVASIGMNPTIMKCCSELFLEQAHKEMLNGRRVEVDDLFSGRLAITGTFPAANSPWDKTVNKLIPYFVAKGDMTEGFDDVECENVTEGLTCSIKRVMDSTSKTEGVITNAKDVVVLVSGVNLSIVATRSDEGVWLEDQEGTMVAKATIVDSTSTTVDAKFTTLPLADDGNYYLVVASRGGLSTEYGVSMARKQVVVRTANS